MMSKWDDVLGTMRGNIANQAEVKRSLPQRAVTHANEIIDAIRSLESIKQGEIEISKTPFEKHCLMYMAGVYDNYCTGIIITLRIRNRSGSVFCDGTSFKGKRNEDYGEYIFSDLGKEVGDAIAYFLAIIAGDKITVA
jgi:hypothetical protein